ncbi:MAG: 30S ribosomal protein S18 [Candidatus Sungbacteria bacterium]|nr:30S ribosomal protein S18 [Candidatus Sungbacteria bacterium]
MKKQCPFCTKNQKVIDYKSETVLREFISGQMKIMPRKRSGVCAKHQRKLSTAIKRARFLGLLPYTLPK